HVCHRQPGVLEGRAEGVGQPGGEVRSLRVARRRLLAEPEAEDVQQRRGGRASQTAAPASPGITPSLLSSFLSRSRHCSQYEVDLLISESTAATITPA